MDLRERETHEIEAYEAALRETHVDDESLRISEYSIRRYSAPMSVKRLPVDMLFKILAPVTDMRVLDCGCGDGEFSTIIGLLGASVTGIDISERLTGIARRRAAINGVADRVRFVRCSIHDMPFSTGSFDIAFGKGVLHHVDIESAGREIHRVLKAGGRAVFEEPVALSGLLLRIRQSAPVSGLVKINKITPDERPLTASDIALFSSYFRANQVHYLQLLSRLDRFFRSARALDWLNAIDTGVMRMLPVLRRYGRLAILNCHK